ncbi:hypothetical protein A3F97_00030 [Candidatus Nomurabacteria bacterium RIFCSPLOWO2_12_FULL_41_10]|uniref:Uncharacterized protein n=1 Tax=Candidatus Nomurabacteria bacterium RIFCSPLOWO2_12_FULL_41_10 TaxID=1801795 RepID=A0A1F6YDU9_9BACT|nr:MAG: hypothetical protein A3F97_00030 [Candidatus Nomurabacteria bacterium RIFCSPLOWO2_12_FULL_41_10]
MSKKQIIIRGFIDALGVAAYVTVFAWVINNLEHWFGDVPDTWLAPVLMLLVFIISACVTGSLVLLKPVLLYVEGQKKESVSLFVFTIGFLVILALIIAFIVMGR